MVAVTLILLVIGVIEIIIAFGIDWGDYENCPLIILSSGFTATIIAFIYTICILVARETEIEPIEVYRGSTTLQITYQDNIPIDSVVVYKNK